MEQRLRETLRYLGYGKYVIDESTSHLITESFAKLEAIKRERFVYRFSEIERLGEHLLQIENMQIQSKDLIKNLAGCKKCAIFAATLGIEVDIYIRKCTMLDMANTVIVQACAATLMEEFCDRIEQEIRDEVQKDKMKLKPRFSAGYGDFRIEHQEHILAILEAQKKIGLMMTESFMMVPTKSVTALIGIIQ